MHEMVFLQSFEKQTLFWLNKLQNFDLSFFNGSNDVDNILVRNSLGLFTTWLKPHL